MDTLEFYEANAEEYAAESLTHDVLDDRGRFISRLPRGARILDLGCGYASLAGDREERIHST